MCGIAGILSLSEKKVDNTLLKKMAEVIAHRGPDGEGFWINNEQNLGFAHRRLAIIDLSDTAKQPMKYLGRYTIILNGEIYNYIELKQELIKAGYKFYTQSDTEVLLALYDHKKEKCLNEVDGMFAFAIYDEIEKSLFIARDRFGEKPFFYYKDERYFVFCSEIKGIWAIKQQLNLQVEIDDVKVEEYLLNGKLNNPRDTYFKKIGSLLPAHYLKIEANNFKFQQYWELDLSKQITYSKEDSYIEHFKFLFEESVKHRLRSDVLIGTSLSGGLDSSSIVGILSSISPKLNFTTFSAVFPGFKRDESYWINLVSKYTGTTNLKVQPNALIFLEQIENLCWHHEEPISVGSNFAQWSVMQLATQNKVKVLIDGQGADEYMAGYSDLKYYAIWQLYREFKMYSFFNERKLFRKYYGPKESLGFKYLIDPLLLPFNIKRKEFDYGVSIKEKLKYSITNEFEHLLRCADRNSMAFSIEVRLPFLYHKLVEFIFSIPNNWIYSKGLTKYILRKSVENKLPQELIYRRDKIGFAAPQEDEILLKEFKEKESYYSFLKNSTFKPSSNQWRNMAAGAFIKKWS